MPAKKPEPTLSLEEYRDLQDKEWSQYVATERIYIGGALAFVPGDAVPASHVTNKVVNKDQVESATAPTEA